MAIIWNMVDIHIVSVDAPFDRATLVGPATSLLRRAGALGLLGTADPVTRLDLALVRTIAREAAAAGIGQDAARALMEEQPDASRLQRLIERLDDALAGSPLPERELAELRHVFDVDGLAGHLGVSPISLRRYLAGTRTTPDDVAARIHWLAFVVSDLAGAYNEIGIRRWFERPRAQLGGRSPREVLGVDWDAEGADARSVASLAAALAGPGAAT